SHVGLTPAACAAGAASTISVPAITEPAAVARAPRIQPVPNIAEPPGYPSETRLRYAAKGTVRQRTKQILSAGGERVLGQAAGDDPRAEGLVGAFEDREPPGVDEEPRDRELLGVAHAPVELHRLAGHPLRGATHVRLHHRRLERALAGRHLARHVVRELPAGL